MRRAEVLAERERIEARLREIDEHLSREWWLSRCMVIVFDGEYVRVHPACSDGFAKTHESVFAASMKPWQLRAFARIADAVRAWREERVDELPPPVARPLWVQNSAGGWGDLWPLDGLNPWPEANQ